MLLSFIASENFALMLAVGSTLVWGGVVGGTVLTTVGAPGAAQAIPAARISARDIVVNSSSVFLMIFLSSHVFTALRDRFRGAYLKTPLFGFS
jgi:hypothetical protein